MKRFSVVKLMLVVSCFGSMPAMAASPAVCKGVNGYSDSFDGGRLFIWNPDWLQLSRQRHMQNDSSLKSSMNALIKKADAALSKPRYSVVDKTKLPKSGDRHDYMSMGPYWWPDPSKPDGLPYIRRDGQVNPERDSEAFDAMRMERMSSDVQALTLAYYFTGDSRYGRKAADQIRAWFLTPETRMNPNLSQAQAVPGREAGRAEGIIDAHRLPRVIESIAILQKDNLLSSSEVGKLEKWFGNMAKWMQTSKIGKEESEARNNHGMYYDTLLTHFALFARDSETARKVAEKAGVKRFAAQINSKGQLTEELTRTRSLHYVTWTLNAAYDLADLGSCVGVDLWNYKARNGNGSLRKATDFISPYAQNVSSWPYPEQNKSDTDDFFKAMRRASLHWKSGSYEQAADALKDSNKNSEWTVLVPERSK